MIAGYIGAVGAGKTLNMVYDLMEEMRWGNRVVSNTPIEFDWRGKHYSAEFIRNSEDFKKAMIYEQNCVLAIDEASVFLPNNYWNKIPPEIIAKFAQSRHFAMDMYYTTQGWGHTVKRLRDLTTDAYLCRRRRFFGFSGLPVFPFITKKWNNKYRKNQWTLKTVDAMVFERVKVAPAYFKSSATTYKRLKHMIYRTRRIYPTEARSIYPVYDTRYNITGSALVRMNNIYRPDFQNASKKTPGQSGEPPVLTGGEDGLASDAN